MKILVVGGGIFGATAALTLVRRGHTVSLLAPGPLPDPRASTTDISKVVRMDYGADVLYTDLMEQAMPLWEADPLYHGDGFLILRQDELLPGGFEHDSFQMLTARGHALTRLTSSTLAAGHPAWSAARYPDGYYNPRAGWAESGALLDRTLREAFAAGVRWIDARAAEVVEGGVITTDGQQHTAEHTIIAAGPWTPTLLPELSRIMAPIAQPVLHFRPADPARYSPPEFPTWAADISSTGWYGFPVNAEGILKVANHGPGERLDPDAPRTVGPAVEAKFRAFFAETFPGLVDAPLIGSRLCLYCDTTDGHFFIDRHAHRPGVTVAAGGCGHGFKFAPLLGGMIADVVEGGAPIPRFSWRTEVVHHTEQARFDG